jgi:hypothetical protein
MRIDTCFHLRLRALLEPEQIVKFKCSTNIPVRVLELVVELPAFRSAISS